MSYNYLSFQLEISTYYPVRNFSLRFPKFRTHPVVVVLFVHLDLVVVAAGSHDVVVRMPDDLMKEIFEQNHDSIVE
jgi:hypothetical protein